MKTKILLRLLAFCSLLIVSYPLLGQRTAKFIAKNNIASLKPYTYDCYTMMEISYGTKAQTIVVEFSVYSDEDYKLLFCKTTLPQSIDINVYDKNPKSKNKKLIYFEETGEKDQYVCNFQPTQTCSYFIEYKIPPATGENQKGYIVVLIGVKDIVEDNPMIVKK